MSPRLSLPTLLLVDASTCALMGVILLFGSGPIAALTAIPAALLFYAGLALLPVAAFMALAATCRPVPPAAAWIVILGNVLWIALSLLLLLAGWITPNSLGVVFILVQALAVAILTILEHAALRDRAAVLKAG
jgi:hypothetical protein